MPETRNHLAVELYTTVPQRSGLCRVLDCGDDNRRVQVMASPVVGLEPVVQVARVVALLRQTKHNGFPVLAPWEGGPPGDAFPELLDDEEEEDARREARGLLGIILRSQLLVMLERGFFCDAQGTFVKGQSGPQSGYCVWPSQ